jgi:hypothetical protein
MDGANGQFIYMKDALDEASMHSFITGAYEAPQQCTTFTHRWTQKKQGPHTSRRTNR